jgi:hypothetical protein
MRLLGVAVLVLLSPPAAVAALEVRLSVVPRSPKASAPAVVELRPYWTHNRADGTCCRLAPADVDYPFKVEAVSPAGRVFRVAVKRTADAYVWSGSFRFRTPGRWTLRAPQWGPRYSRNYGARPRIRLNVRR